MSIKMKFSSLYIFFITLSSTFSCQKQDTLEHITLPVSGNAEQTFSGKSITEHAATVFVFLSPECPLSENYSFVLRSLSEKYTSQDILFYAVIPGKLYTELETGVFRMKYLDSITTLIDAGKKLTDALHAFITPEVFLLNKKMEIIYSGSIDNWAVDLGTKRQNITEHYLQNAIEAWLRNETPKISKTNAVGCFIE
jgi:hypothetical protein